MIHLKSTYDQRRTKKGGTHPIVFRITVKGKSRDISSGLSCQPTQADINLTRKFKDAGSLLDIQVTDHLIVTENGYSSFADEGLL